MIGPKIGMLAVLIALMITGYAPALLCMFGIVIILWVWTHP